MTPPTAPRCTSTGVVVTRLEDLDRLGSWRDEDPAQRRFLVLDLRVSGAIAAPYQEEIYQVNNR